ncbi:MAG: exodeoxyribonuclease VII large subunit [Chloroflexi bacterium]|nr:MAG: exodeoxyribonuclease VII large subunit [Chloroflexota bacterium]
MNQHNLFTVSQLNRHVRSLLDGDPILQDCWVEGEVSNYSRATSGHVYFTLKDESARLSCVMWRSNFEWQTYTPEDGHAVVCHGYVSVYETQGRYQLYVDEIQPAGRGLLHLEFEALKQKLAAEGLFDETRKRPLPAFPRRIGIVTSPQAAALRDICNVLARRYPLPEVILAPTLVQGEEAPAQIVAALNALNQIGVDVVILARGGGSLEELWAFNNENVARAVAASQAPVVCGVGHQTDYTIADFVADVRAPTPSAAAELVVPDRAELQQTLRRLQIRLLASISRQLDEKARLVEQQHLKLATHSPTHVINEYRQRVDGLIQTGQRAIIHRLALARERLNSSITQLNALDPKATLARGYAIVSRLDTGRPVTSVRHVQAGDPISVQVSDGSFESVVGRKLKHRPATPGGSTSTASQLGLDLD